MIKHFKYGRCEYCRYHRWGKCQLGLVPVRDDSCYEEDCFLSVGDVK